VEATNQGLSVLDVAPRSRAADEVQHIVRETLSILDIEATTQTEDASQQGEEPDGS